MEGALDKPKQRPFNGGAGNASTGAVTGGGALRAVKFIAALAMLPLCAGMTLGAYDFFMGVWTHAGSSEFGARFLLRWFGMGGAAFAALGILLWRPVVVYVFAHELMHALAAWLCLGKVSNLSASANGGQVTTSKTNTLIRLAPYCVPFYALLLAAVYTALNAWWRPLGAYLHWAAFALGFSYTFHVVFTLWSLRRDQPDLKPDGWLFSLVVVYLANVAVFALTMGFLFGGNARSAWPALKETGVTGWRHSVSLYGEIEAAGRRAIQRGGQSRAEIETPKEQ